ncbi:Arm DNA-binding domain-containing protein [Motiliproteus sp. SC1-56]|uniref:Arm DNA-binding domain-containing protein n=1 Tax=Motiliproteus sp. SC1-56 TaxID=2799565 RepID=UPI001A8D6D97|nr:DUF3596 domain-containing protein [Motiliproteus sp. SC1-56]
MATFHIRPNHILQYDICVYGVRFRETSGLPATPANIKRVTAQVKKINAQLALGTFEYRDFFPHSKKVLAFEALKREKTGNPDDPFFLPFAEHWFNLHAPAWKKSYRKAVTGDLKRHLFPHFGNWRLTQITREAALAFRNELLRKTRADGSRQLGNNRINGLMILLGAILRYARDELDIPFVLGPVKPLRTDPTDPRPLTLPEVEKFLSVVDPFYRDYYIVRLFTGMRGCEMSGLRDKDLDFDHRLIRVRAAWVQGEMTDLKTQYSRRDIPMIAPVYDALQRARAKTQGKGGLVFLNPFDRPIDNRWLAQKAWYPALRKADLRRRNPHQSRHTAAVLHLAAHENPGYISRILGHSSSKLLFDVYAPYIHNATRQDGSAFEAMVSPHFS